MRSGVHTVYDEDTVLAGAEALAERIRSSGYDVIALNEVFSDRAAEILAAALFKDYPHIVHSIGNPGFDEGHSGLALFSKLPFVEITPHYSGNGLYSLYDQAIIWRNGDIITPEEGKAFVAFMPFGEACEGPDCYSTKGVGYVRLHNTETERKHNVFFTHMQATYLHELEDDPSVWQGAETRELQLSAIRQMILDGTPDDNENPIRFGTEDVFLMGDLNVEGDRSNTVDDMDVDGISVLPFDNLGEWTKYFRGLTWNGGFFVESLHDTWAKEHPIADTFFANPPQKSEFGPTHGNGDCGSGSGSEDGCRWDYILHNTPQLGSNGLCNQHPHRAFNLDSGAPMSPGANPPGGRGELSDGLMGQPGTGFRSDHLGVSANYNVLAAQCSPLLPASANSVYGPHPEPGVSFGVKTLTSADVGNLSDGQKNYSEDPIMQSGVLTAPGSVQWWRVTEPGTYLVGFEDDFNASQANTSFEIGYQAQVYASSSLSVPMPSYKDQFHRGVVSDGEGTSTIHGHKFIFDEPPYYIKVFHPAHRHLELPFNATGSYKFAVRRLGCTDKFNDACPIIPNTIQNLGFPAGAVNSSPTQDSLYFDLDVQSLTIPDSQQLQMMVFDYRFDRLHSSVVNTSGSSDVVAVFGGNNVLVNGGADTRLFEEGHDVGSDTIGSECAFGGPTPQQSPLPHGLPLPGFPQCNNIITFNHPNPSAGTTSHAWKVTRIAGVAQSMPFSIAWTTDLTAFYGKQLSPSFPGMNLVCEEETSDGSPHDEIGIRIRADDENLEPWNAGFGVFIADFEQGESVHIDDFVAQFGSPIKYKTLLTLGLVEEDTGDNKQVLNWDTRPLGRNVFGPASAEEKVFPDWPIDDGHYTTAGLRSHGTQKFLP